MEGHVGEKGCDVRETNVGRGADIDGNGGGTGGWKWRLGGRWIWMWIGREIDTYCVWRITLWTSEFRRKADTDYTKSVQ